MRGEAIIIGKGLAVTNDGYLKPIPYTVTDSEGKKKKAVRRTAVLNHPFTIKGTLKEGDKVKCLFRMPGRLIAFDCEIGKVGENISVNITSEYSDKVEGLIKKIQDGCN